MQLLKLAVIFGLCVIVGHSQQMENTTHILSRRRRYVAFPDGSSISAAICMTIGVIGNPVVEYLSWAVNWGVAYNLPNYAWARRHANGFQNETKATLQRRSRRDLYDKMSLAMDNMGFPGSTCVFRMVCEGAQYIQQMQQRKGNMVEEIIKTILDYPAHDISSNEPEIHHHFANVQRRAKRSLIDCSKVYAHCPFSLLQLALGRYDIPSTHVTQAKSFAFM